ncbi:hypothetical protein [Thiocapsa sp.]|uniref:hypothetical protein n=1 Tax=Thiocapsa sp. TaxID=2024551 RepID=UPI002CF13D9E|nr:hypothetical protein [Thiocapsa sp.]HSO82406.1 hypothetical protein [Thiocapsa sp.]
MRKIMFLISLTLASSAVAMDYQTAHRIANEHRQRLHNEELMRIQRERAYREKEQYYQREREVSNVKPVLKWIKTLD